MTDGNEDDVNMAECGVCRAVVPINSENCPECGVSFSGVSEESLGECGACKALIPLDSESCPQCGVTFVADNVIEVLSNWLTATGLSTRDLFVKFDANNDGKITSEEFRNGLLSLKLADLPPSQIERLVSAIDEDGDGIIDLEELSNTFGEPDNKPLKEIVAETEESSSPEDNTEEEEEIIDEIEDEDSVDISAEESEESAEEEESEESAEGEESDDVQEDDESNDDDDSEGDEDVASDEEEYDDEQDDEFMRFGKAIVAEGYTIREVFESLDTNEDGLIDGPELQSGLAEILGEKLVAEDVHAILKTIDKDEDGNIDAMEIIEALEKLDLGIESDRAEVEVVKEFPTPLQKMIMGKTANDIIYPICYFLAFAFITLWVVNGMGLIVDGTGGNVVYAGHTDDFGIEWDQGDYNICDVMPDLSDCKGHVIIGDIYPCDPSLDEGKCANSLTPLLEHSSMTAGFYGDGIFMIILGLMGFGAVLFLHLVYAKSLREKVRALNGEEEKDYDKVDSEVDSEAENEAENEEEEGSGDEEDSEQDNDEDEDDDSEETNSDADIDIGSEIGLVLEDEEFYGTIIEFDDDEGLVTIETEDGEEITGYQDDMFIE